MAVKLRLRRMGKKKRPFYRIVAADSRAPRDGRIIELVGTYDPISKPKNISLKEERIMYWLQNGAQPTDTVKNLFQKTGVWLKWHLQKTGATEAKISEELGKWELVQKEKAARQQAKEEEKKRKKAAAKEEEAETGGEETPAEEAAAPVEETESAQEEDKKEETAQDEVKAEEPAPAPEEDKKTEQPASEETKEEEPASESKAKTEEGSEDTEEAKK